MVNKLKLLIFISVSALISCEDVYYSAPFVPEVSRTPDVISTTSNSATFDSPIEAFMLSVGIDSNDLNLDYRYSDCTLSGLLPYTTYFYASSVSNHVGDKIIVTTAQSCDKDYMLTF